MAIKQISEKIPNYQVMIAESNKYVWYVETSGRVYRTTKDFIEQNRAIKEKDKVYLTPYLTPSKSSLRIKINGKDRTLKCIVAKAFLSRVYQEDDIIKYKDGNLYNCNANNLLLIPKSTYCKKTGPMSRSKACFIKRPDEEKAKRYRSVREAAKSLYVSYQTLLDYLSGKRKGILHDMGIVAYYE